MVTVFYIHVNFLDSTLDIILGIDKVQRKQKRGLKSSLGEKSTDVGSGDNHNYRRTDT